MDISAQQTSEFYARLNVRDSGGGSISQAHSDRNCRYLQRHLVDHPSITSGRWTVVTIDIDFGRLLGFCSLCCGTKRLQPRSLRTGSTLDSVLSKPKP